MQLLEFEMQIKLMAQSIRCYEKVIDQDKIRDIDIMDLQVVQ